MIQSHLMMESNLSLLSSLKEDKSDDYIQPHYREAYRLAIDSLVSGGRKIYQEFLQAEKIASFLSEDEIQYITQTVELLPDSDHSEDIEAIGDEGTSTGTYWPTHSDTPPPDLDLGWPEVTYDRTPTNIDLFYHPPRLNSPTIKEMLRKHIQDARKVIAIAMDVFTDIDLFKEAVDASVRGVAVYILLDHNHFKSFLSMAANLDIQLPKLRNMRVRTVKGHEYVCRSGAKFHGSMGQKFLLIDCQTVFFGSYSFMWSYEKIHLTMVQVITGNLVNSYDEEFRTLYARSTIPAEFQPQEVMSDRRLNGKIESYISHPIKTFERKDHLRHTLDSVYRQACERQLGFKSTMEDLPVPISHRSRFLQESTDFNKRHSYAGERQEPSYITQRSKYGSSNWNVAEDSKPYGGNYYHSTMDNPYETTQMNRATNMRQSYHGHDKQVLLMQQNLPTLASTSKSFLRTWRIESYLNNPEAPTGESYDYLDQYEMENKPVPAMPSRLRSSLVFRSIIPEDPEPNSYTMDSVTKHRDDQFGMQPGTQSYNSAKHNQNELMGSRVQPDDFVSKRQSIQVPDHSGNHSGYAPGREAIYASLGRAKNRFRLKESELAQDNLYKRHSVADPRHSTYNSSSNENSRYIFGSLLRGQTEKGTLGENSRSRGYPQNLKEDQRSISHYDFKQAEIKDMPQAVWQEPSRTISATGLEVEEKEQNKPNAMSSPRFFKNSSKKIKSLLNIYDRRDGSPKTKNVSNIKMGGSSDTIISDDTIHGSEQDINQQGSTTISMKSTESSKLKRSNGKISVTERYTSALTGDSSAPRFTTEALHSDVRTPGSRHSFAYNDRTDLGQDTKIQWQRERGGASRLYSRFEPLCNFDPKHTSSGQGPTRSSLLTRGNLSHNQRNHVAPQTQGNENKLGRLIQRVGNFINKNK